MYKKVKNLFNNDKDKWVNIEITVMIWEKNFSKCKKLLIPKAKELNWEITSKTETIIENNTKNGGEIIKKFNITLHPKDSLISPKDLSNIRDKIATLSFVILRDFFYEGNVEEAKKHFKQYSQIEYNKSDKAKPDKNDYYMATLLPFLRLEYKLKDRIKYEQRNKELAIKLFGNTVEEALRKLLVNSTNEENQRIKKDLKKLFRLNL
jgi:hypothetical protein